MDKINVHIKCDEGICNRDFTIAVASEFAGKRIALNCPGCLKRYVVRIPRTQTKEEARSALDTIGNAIEKVGEAVEGIIEKTGEFLLRE